MNRERTLAAVAAVVLTVVSFQLVALSPPAFAAAYTPILA